jgi:hypothetical protein
MVDGDILGVGAASWVNPFTVRVMLRPATGNLCG